MPSIAHPDRLRRRAFFAVLLAASPSWAQTRPVTGANPIDLNAASRDVLMTLEGIGEVKADAIIRSRPFRAKTELVERRIVPEALYEKIADKVFARAPPAPTPAKPAAPAPAGPIKRG
jgi:radical SAM superfamily enzyme with C-terminal helix-hairpin-helix motif